MISKNHPRASSLKVREKLVAGVQGGITSQNGLIAHGRGEAFDYLLGENTRIFAQRAIGAAAVLLVQAKNPILSINGNVAALCPKKYITLANALLCPIEVNLFHRTFAREEAIKKVLKDLGAKKIVGVGNDASKELKHVFSKRRFVSPKGIASADVVLVPLEDGDRCEALIKMGKKVIAIDLNPLSRTAQMATITIVDNITRALPLLITRVKELTKRKASKLEDRLASYHNKKILSESIMFINKRLMRLT